MNDRPHSRRRMNVIAHQRDTNLSPAMLSSGSPNRIRLAPDTFIGFQLACGLAAFALSRPDTMDSSGKGIPLGKLSRFACKLLNEGLMGQRPIRLWRNFCAPICDLWIAPGS